MRAFYTLHFGLTPARLHPLARLTRLAYIKKYKRGYSVHISKVEHTKLIIHYFYIINVCHYANLYLDTSVTEQPSSIGEKFPLTEDFFPNVMIQLSVFQNIHIH